MTFIDEAKINLKAGDGGKGCVSFRRESFEPLGGPDGGNGGRGGNIIFQAKHGMNTLLDFKFKREFKADRGQHGMGATKDGRAGADMILYVPLGTVIHDEDTGEVLADLASPGDEVVAAKGGRGGKGNTFFKTSVNQAPRYAQPGEAGEEKNLRLELKLLADVGLIGMPNAGKSTLISVISRARPKIADYPFTTLSPCLGVVAHRDFPPFVVADIPGLIEGAHTGSGLGDRFLKHIERTRLLVHLISLGPDELEEPIDRYLAIRRELESYSSKIKKKKELIVFTKVDLEPDKKILQKKIAPFKKKKKNVFVISSAIKSGIEELMDEVAKFIETK